MDSAHTFLKGVIFTIIGLALAVPLSLFAQTPGYLQLATDNLFEYQNGTLRPGENFSATEYKIVATATVKEDNQGDVINRDSFFLVEGTDTNKTLWLVRNQETETIDQDTGESSFLAPRQEWARVKDGLELFGLDIARGAANEDEFKKNEDLITKAYAARISELSNGRYVLESGYVDLDGLGDTVNGIIDADFSGIIRDTETGKYGFLWHEDMGNVGLSGKPLTINDITFDLNSVINDDDFLEDVGIDDLLSNPEREAALKAAAASNNNLNEQKTLEQQLTEALDRVEQAVVNVRENPTEENVRNLEEANAEAARISNEIKEKETARQQFLEEVRRANVTDSGGSGTDLFGAIADPLVRKLEAIVEDFFKFISLLLVKLSALFLGIAGVALNYVINMFVLNMSYLVGDGSTIGATIEVAWTVIRDLMNIAFIFIILWIAGSIILDIDKGISRKSLPTVIIVAILINFSLFFTKVVIDVANILTLSLNENILDADLSNRNANIGVEQDNNGNILLEITNYGISGQLMTGLGITTAFKASEVQGETLDYVINSLIISFFLCTTAVIFFAVAVMLLIRFIVLIIVMIASPAAFMGYALPQLRRSITDKWTNALISNAFFAPVFFLALSVVFLLMEAIQQNEVLKTDFSHTQTPEFGITLISYTLMTSLIIACLWTAKSMGAHGGSMAVERVTKIGQFVKGAAFGGGAMTLRNTFGWAGGRLSRNAAVNRLASKSRIGSYALKGSRALANAGGANSYEARRKAKAEKEKTFANSLTLKNDPKRIREIARAQEEVTKLKDAAEEAREAYFNAKGTGDEKAKKQVFEDAQKEFRKQSKALLKPYKDEEAALKTDYVKSRESARLGYVIPKHFGELAARDIESVSKRLANSKYGWVQKIGAVGNRAADRARQSDTWVSGSDADARRAIQEELSKGKDDKLAERRKEYEQEARDREKEKDKETKQQEKEDRKQKADQDKKDRKQEHQEQVDALNKVAGALSAVLRSQNQGTNRTGSGNNPNTGGGTT